MPIALLGPLEIAGAPPALSPRDRIVLVALAIRSGEVVTPDRLADAVWGEAPPASWAKQLQICVMRLRKALGAAAIETTPHGYRLTMTGDDVDVARFEQLIERGHALATSGDPERAAATYTRALALWRGAPFDDLDCWLPARNEAARLEELRRTVEEDLLDARLAAGEHREVAIAGEARVAEEPLRERRWALLALAQYRSGRQADALRSLQQARRILAEQLGIDPGPELVALEAAILDQDDALAAAPPARTVAGDCPYKGLAPYDVADTESFFGRESDVAACVDRLQTSAFLVVAGPSGCGKSSLVRAGVVPFLQRRGRSVVVFAPGADPDGALSAALASVSGSPVVVVDQFEEVFMTDGPRERARAFCAQLATYAAEQASVIVTVRADHLADLAADPALARLTEQGLHLVSPLAGEMLHAAIEGPALQAALRLEPGLVDLLVRDTEGEPGALPLLSHALVETWLRRDGRVLTVEGYRATGGIRGAVALSADRLYESLAPADRVVLRSVLMRLVTLGEDGEPIRSRVARRTFAKDPVRERVVGLLVRARLVTAGEETVELAHEALGRAWPRLRTWLDDDADGQRILRHLTAAAEDWDSLGRSHGELYRGARLDIAVEWRDAASRDLTAVESAFLAASVVAATAERVAVVERARQQTRQNSRLRNLLVMVAMLLIVSLIAGAVALRNGRDSRAQRDAARVSQQTAQLETLTSQSLALRSTNRSVAALLAVEAYRRRPDASAWSALLGTFTAAPTFMGYEYMPDGIVASGVLVPGTSSAVVFLGGKKLALLDLETGAVEDHFDPPPAIAMPSSVLRISDDARFVVLMTDTEAPEPCGVLERLRVTNDRGCGAFTVYEMSSGRKVIGPITPPFGFGDVAISADGALVAVAGGYDGDLAVYRTADGAMVGSIAGLPRPADVFLIQDTAALAFGPDNLLYAGSLAGPIRALDPTTVRVVATYDTPPQSSHLAIAVTPDGILYATGQKAIVSVDTTTGVMRWSTDARTGAEYDACFALALAESEGHLYCGSFGGVIEQRDLATGQRTRDVLEPQLGGLADVSIAPGGRDLVVFGANAPVVSRWRLDGSGLATSHIAAGYVESGYDPTGEKLLVARRDDLVVARPDLVDYAIWDPLEDAAVDPVDDDLYLAAWGGRDLLAAVFADQTASFYDLVTRGRDPDPVDAEVASSSDRAWMSVGGDRLYVSVPRSGRCEIRTFDTERRVRVEPTIQLDACNFVLSLGATPDGSRVVLTAGYDDTPGFRTTVHDGRTGRPVGDALPDRTEVGVNGDGVLVAADSSGDLTQYDLDTLRPVGKFPGAVANIRRLEFSADGEVLLSVARDDTVSIYDVATRTRIGDPISGGAPNLNFAAGSLRPDGRAVVVNDPNGIVVWDIDPDHLVDAACRLAGRNLTATEWNTYLADLGLQRDTCAAPHS